VKLVFQTVQPEASVLEQLRARLYPAVLFVLMIVLNACASVPTDYPRTASTAFQDHEASVFGKKLAADAAQHPGKSGFAIVRYDKEPEASFGQRFQSGFIEMLPVQSQL
jgi:hypothetical protein